MAKTRKTAAGDKEAATHVALRSERSIDLPARDYQPTKAEKEESFDMPGADVETVRAAFFRPVRVSDR